MSNFKKGDKVVMRRVLDTRYKCEGLVVKVMKNGDILSEHVLDLPRTLSFSKSGLKKSDPDYYIEAKND